MSYIHKTSLIILIILVQTRLKVSAVDDPLYQLCSSSAGSFSPNSVYVKTLNTLLGSLQTGIVTPSGFSRAAIHKKLFGIALCRGDVNSTECNTCVVDASAEIRKRCPYNKGAIIWYDNCFLKYLDHNFFGQIDIQNKFELVNVANISNNPTLFNQKVKGLLSNLADQGSRSRVLYAAGETKLDTFTNLYGLAQCTQDLSSKDCKICLDEAISELPSCCDGRQGGRVVGGSCNVRYEVYPFLNSS
ncbi:hypothetical protein SOVF_178630 [Spinacia oleracea]|uniref:Cysteine-rich repeat secretory protein 38-like n=1 Tax=Spinacia oleracea TaxID=3562 RepID=A0A9R0K3V1_SPIOL|nr:cysteine-rich repeat secretory protein 38-like [Spinacia oleracea]KNA06697.1 hypothetical protein SOVF_178630 [Spinacia oleracea]